MRFLCFLFLIVFAGAVALFAYQNQYEITLTFWDREITAPMPVIAAAIFAAGMLSGWTIVGMVRRSVYTVVSGPLGRRQYYA